LKPNRESQQHCWGGRNADGNEPTISPFKAVPEVTISLDIEGVAGGGILQASTRETSRIFKIMVLIG